MKIFQDKNIIVIRLKSGFELEIHGKDELLSIITKSQCWDASLSGGKLFLDGHDVHKLIVEKIYKS